MFFNVIIMRNILLATGANVNVDQVIEKLLDFGIEAGKNIIGAIIIYIVGRFIIKQIGRLLMTILEKRKLEVSVQTFLRSLLNIL